MNRGMAWGFVVLALGAGACGSDDKTSGGSAGMHTAIAAGSGGTGTAGANAAGTGAAVGGAEATAGDSAGGEPASGGSGGSGGSAVGAHCTLQQPFGTPHPITELNTAEHEAGARLTSDELSIVYLCAAGERDQVCFAQRPTRSSAFGKPAVLVFQNGGVPWISDDLLVLLYEDTLKNRGVSISQRKTIQDPFPETGFNPVFNAYGDPFVVGGNNGHLYLSQGTLGAFSVMTLTDWEPGKVQEVPSKADGARPTLTPDELTMYFVTPTSLASGLKDEIWVQQRQTVNAAFDGAAPVTELNTTPENFPSWISPDGCRLYFDAGMFPRDLYVAERN